MTREEAMDVARAFLEHHELPTLRCRLDDPRSLGCIGAHKPEDCPWSWPRSVEDCTVLGRVCHEVGHHLLCYVQHRHPRTYDGWWKNWCTNVRHERPVSSHEPDEREAFAEAVRLFVLNPTLLEEGRPGRYGMLTDGLGLEPLVTDHWTDVISTASMLHVKSVEAWISA